MHVTMHLGEKNICFFFAASCSLGSLHSKKSTSARAVSSIPFPKHSPRSHICNLHICRRPQTRFPFRKGPKGSPVVGLWVVGLLRPLANSVFHLGSCFHPTKSTPQNTPTETSFFDTSFQMERNSFIHYYLVGELNHFQPI